MPTGASTPSGAAPEAQASLHRKLAAVMAAVGYVPKNGQGPGYKFASATDVADKVRGELAARNLTMLPAHIERWGDPGETTLSGKQSVVTLKVQWLITDGDSGESVTIESVGTGADSGDKATNKAQTIAMKYAMLLAFAIPTGDDPEADNGDAPVRRAARAPRQQAAAAAPVYPVLTDDELEQVRGYVKDILDAPDEAALKAVGATIGQDEYLTEPMRGFLAAAYTDRRAALRGAVADAA